MSLTGPEGVSILSLSVLDAVPILYVLVYEGVPILCHLCASLSSHRVS